MKKVFAALLVSLALVSCQKEVSFETDLNNSGGSSNIDINGVWNFIELREDITTTTSADLGGFPTSSTAAVVFTSYNNSGTVEFDGSNVIFHGIAYSVDTTMSLTVQVGGLPGTTQTAPLQYDFGPQDITQGYRKITADSIAVDQTSGGTLDAITTVQGGTVNFPSELGAKFEMKDGYLLMHNNLNFTAPYTAGGMTMDLVSKGVATYVLKK